MMRQGIPDFFAQASKWALVRVLSSILFDGVEVLIAQSILLVSIDYDYVKFISI